MYTHSEIEIASFPVIAYLSNPNMINTMGTHIGQLYRIFPYYNPPTGSFIASASKFNPFNMLMQASNVTDMINETRFTHRMAALRHCFANSTGRATAKKSVGEWPLGPLPLLKFFRLCNSSTKWNSSFDPADSEATHDELQDMKVIGYSTSLSLSSSGSPTTRKAYSDQLSQILSTPPASRKLLIEQLVPEELLM